MTPARVLADPAYPRLKSLLIESTGLAYYESRDQQLSRLVHKRLETMRIGNCSDYLAHLSSSDGQPEIETLVCELTIGETYFFRHRELFAALRDRILPEALAAPGRRVLRIWSAGCSIGAEAYSVSVLLRRDLAHLLGDTLVTIIGTDINREFLAEAQGGVFGDWALRSVLPEVRDACFRPKGNKWELLPRFREGVVFRRQNLVQDSFPANEFSAFDLILCRNVMIYFEAEVLDRLVRQFHDCLVPGGWLLVGHAEPAPGRFAGFEPLYAPGAVAYRRPSTVPAPLPPPVVEPVSLPPLPPPPVREPKPEPAPAPAAANQLRAWLDAGAWEDVIAWCANVIELDPFDAHAYYARALALEHTGHAPEAERDLRRALYLDREHVLAHLHLARLLKRHGRHRDAAPLLRAARRLVEHADETHLVGNDELTVKELRTLLEVHDDG